MVRCGNECYSDMVFPELYKVMRKIKKHGERMKMWQLLVRYAAYSSLTLRPVTMEFTSQSFS
jgi:hypothetical protein